MKRKRSNAIPRFFSMLMVAVLMLGISPAFAEGAGEPVDPNDGFYAYVPCTPNAPVTTYAFKTPKSGAVNVSFDVTPLADSVDGHVAFNTANCVMGFSSDRKIDIMLRPDGKFAANNNAATASAEAIPYVKGQSYHVVLSIDIGAKTFSATVDGHALAANYAFRNKAPTTIDNIGVMGVVALAGSFKVTNISEQLVGLVDNDSYVTNESSNPMSVKGAKIYLVGPTHKFKKVQDVVALLLPGDTVYVDGNAVYPAPIFIDAPLAGTKEKPVAIKGITKNGKRPVIKTLNATNMVEIGANNYVFDNFEVAGNLAEVMNRFPGTDYPNLPDTGTSAMDSQTVNRGVFHKADNLVVSRCVIHDARFGILGADTGSGSITVRYCDVYHNGVRGGEHNLYLSADEAACPDSVARVEFCYIHDSNVGNGLKTRARRNEVYYNWFENNHYQSLELIGPDPGFDGDTFWTAETLRAENPAYGEFFRREDSDVVGNVIIHTRGDLVRVGGDGTSDMSVWDENWENVLKMGPAYGQSYGRYRFVNNTFIDMSEDSARAIRIEFGVESVEMYNNVFYKPAGAPLSVVEEYTATDLINTAKWASGARQVKGANNWVQTNALNVPGTPEWSGTIKGTDPGYVMKLSGNKSITLKPRSPLINAGVCLKKTVATWPGWTNTLFDFSAGSPIPGFDINTYVGTPVQLSNTDNAFPNPLMQVKYEPVNPRTMKALPRASCKRIDIGAFSRKGK